MARADKIRAEVDAKAAAEAARVAETEGRLRARADAEAARAAERAAAIAAKAAVENAGASSRAAAAAEKAVEKARIEAARIAQAQARSEERALQAQTEAQAKAVAEVTRHAERVAAEAARAEERARIVAERAAHAQAKIDSRLAAEAAKQARLLAEMEAHQAAVRAREDAEKARITAKIAAERSRVETIARVQDMVQLTKIKAEAESIVGEAVRKTEEDFEARALANRPVYYGPELEPPGLGHLHHLMAMTDTLTAPAQIAEELAFLAMEHLGCEAVAMMIPDGDCWTTASGIGIGRNDLRYRLSEEHWFVRQVLGREALALIDDTAALRDELSGVPLAGWRYLLGIPLLDANSILVAANSAAPFDAEAVEAFTEGIEDYTAELAESLAVRDVARQIHDRGNSGHRR
jgi:chemotaxis protein histidine kinase CheA